MPRTEIAAACAILCGGTSRRMGRDKAAVTLAGETLLARAVGRMRRVFDEILIVGREQADAAGDTGSGCRFIADEQPGRGPLGGIVTALAWSHSDGPRTERVFVAACDMPFLDEAMVERLWREVERSPAALAVAPRLNGVAQPLAAFYSRGALPVARAALERGELSVTKLLAELDAAYVDIEPGSTQARSLADVDTPADLAMAKRENDNGFATEVTEITEDGGPHGNGNRRRR